MEIAATVALKRDANGWLVPSQGSRGARYIVSPHPTTNYRIAQGLEAPRDNVQPFRCTCPDFELRGLPCKHVFAVQYVIRHEKIDLDGARLTEEVRVTYTQKWPSYNAAQTQEKETFLPMLADLCSTISNPRQVRGRPRLPLSDMAYSAVVKVYSGLSARRFDSDVREAAAKGLTDVDPSFNSVLRYLRDPAMTDALTRLVTLSALPLRAIESDFAMDSTGFSTSTYSRWYDHKWGKEMRQHDWLKLHATTGVLTNVITPVEITHGHSHDTLAFKPMLAKTAENFTIREVSADKAYSSKTNLQAVADLGAVPLIPFKGPRLQGSVPRIFDLNALPPAESADAWTRMYHYFGYQRDAFLASYHKRSNVETTFSMIKRKFGGSLRSKSYEGQVNEILCKVIAHNLCVLIAASHELGLPIATFANVG
jgi:transposase